MAKPTQQENERLSLIRYQLGVAREQADRPSPLNSFALNSVQDATESALMLAAENLGADIKSRAEYLQIFDAVLAKLGGEAEVAGFRAALNALNTARVSFKHHGNTPSQATVHRHVDRGGEFVELLVQKVYALRLEEVSLLVFVRSDEAREQLEKASALKAAGHLRESAEQLALSFHTLVRDFQNRKVWHPGKSLFSTKPSFLPNIFDQRELGDTVVKAYEWLNSIDEWVQNLALGVDMRRYAYFQTHTPRLTFMLGGTYHAHFYEGIDVSDESLERCFRFVVDTALSFAADDFDFDAWAARNG